VERVITGSADFQYNFIYEFRQRHFLKGLICFLLKVLLIAAIVFFGIDYL